MQMRATKNGQSPLSTFHDLALGDATARKIQPLPSLRVGALMHKSGSSCCGRERLDFKLPFVRSRESRSVDYETTTKGWKTV